MTTITIDRAVVEQALEALESVYGDSCDALHALRSALAQQAEAVEPVAEARYDGTLRWLEPHGVGLHRIQGPLYTTPPQRKPLTSDKDRPDQGTTYVEGYGYVDTRAVRAVERAHGIGEGA